MKQSAVGWLEQEIFRRYKFTLQQLNCQPLEEAIEQAKEMEKQQQDKFAIGFAEWCDNNYFRMGRLSFWSESTDWDNNKKLTTKELLEIYKKTL